MSIKSQIISQFEEVAKQQGRRLAPLTNDLVLLESGLDSLCFAIIVSRLEDQFGVDPFSMATEGGFPVTIGEFVNLYENALPQ